MRSDSGTLITLVSVSVTSVSISCRAYGTETALLKVQNEILLAMDRQHVTPSRTSRFERGIRHRRPPRVVTSSGGHLRHYRSCSLVVSIIFDW